MTNNSLTFARTFSYPTTINSDKSSENLHGRRCSSITISPLSVNQDLKADVRQCSTLDRELESSFHANLSWIERCKQHFANIFKKNSKPSTKQDSMMMMMTATMINPNHQQSSTFSYDSELDLREEHLTLVSKRLLSTLRESKIKHLSCDNLFLPCNHIRNIARQCLIMSAEEPFGIMGAQIKIKLTLLSSNMTSTITKYLPVIQINPKQKSTFEIEIDLHEDTKMFTFRRFLPSMKIFKKLIERSPLYVSPRCLLVKNVFYKTAEPKRAFVNSMT